MMPAPEFHGSGSSRIAMIAIGGCDPALREAVDLLAQTGIEVDYMRIRGFPFHKDVEEFLNAHEVIFVVEQNRDAQLRSLLTLETGVSKDRLRSVLCYGGFPLSAHQVVDAVVEQLSGADVLAQEAQ
jgi:2-oxoglutarate ferredoxin oxidoreductase subunit alpha